MLGAIIGDTVGSVYEFHNTKKTDFQPFFHKRSNYTDDSILSFAVADWLLHSDRSAQSLEESLVAWAKEVKCPMGGYGGGFRTWLFHPERLRDYSGALYTDGKRHPYNSWGNGSAMRVSACGWVAHTLEEALDLAKRSAEVTHNHPEGIRGAQATAAAIYMARHGESKEAIRHYVEETFGYDLATTCDLLRPTYKWDSGCQGTVPPAMIAFLDSNSFEEAVRLAVSLGGDSDTLACITGGIAEAYATAHPDYEGITPAMQEHMQALLPEKMWRLVEEVRELPL